MSDPKLVRWSLFSIFILALFSSYVYFFVKIVIIFMQEHSGIGMWIYATVSALWVAMFPMAPCMGVVMGLLALYCYLLRRWYMRGNKGEISYNTKRKRVLAAEEGKTALKTNTAKVYLTADMEEQISHVRCSCYELLEVSGGHLKFQDGIIKIGVRWGNTITARYGGRFLFKLCPPCDIFGDQTIPVLIIDICTLALCSEAVELIQEQVGILKEGREYQETLWGIKEKEEQEVEAEIQQLKQEEERKIKSQKASERVEEARYVSDILNAMSGKESE